MTKINLLPWRERRRDKHKRQFFFLLKASLGATVIFLVALHFMIVARVNRQVRHNTHLQHQIVELDKKMRL